VSGIVSVYFDTDILKSRTDLEDGEFSETLNEYGWYIITVSAKGYHEASDTVWVLNNLRKDVFRDFKMMSLEISNITTANVYFDMNQSTLSEESTSELDEVVKFLQENPELSCKLGGHADRSGQAKYNVEISEKRAIAVAEYLVEKGIDRSRLKTIGYGSLAPLNASETHEDRSKNRRVEIIPYVKKTQDDSNLIFDNILFSTAKYSLPDKSQAELEAIAAFLKDNPNTSCEVAGHTDNTGPAHFNLLLSKERAQIVVNYLISKGIESSRLKVRGYGETRPVELNTTRAGRAKNRRVEFTILD
jgi:outer membrane protein OmpA-like peptidoglycan-associated protein